MNITIQTPKGPINICWSNDDIIRYYEYHQTASFNSYLNGTQLNDPSELPFDMFKKFLLTKIQNRFNSFVQSVEESSTILPDDTKILSIGSGTSTLELVLSHYYSKSTFYLVDKEEFTLTTDSRLFTDNTKYNNTVFQNSWEPLLDGLTTNNIDSTRFNLLSPTDNWPGEIDWIDSIASWGWHYNSPSYIQKSFDSLKIGGKLRLSVLTLPDSSEQFIKEVSDKFNCKPLLKSYVIPATYRSKLQFPHQFQTGGIYIWTKII
jgi:hypothetical protein